MPEFKHRNSFFDNLKALLIFLVVLGHILEPFVNNFFIRIVYNIIYSFHMPAFVFVAGYFSKNIKKQRESLFYDFLIPYFVFNSIYQVFIWRSFKINLFEPVYVYWFLLSMFFWKYLLIDLIKIRFVIVILILISLYSGFIDDVSRYLSISRTITFFPYFMMGYFCTENTISKIKKISKLFGILILVLGSFSIIYLFTFTKMIPIDILKGADSFHNLGLSFLVGISLRLVLILIATFFIISLINLISTNEFKFTYIGKNTLVIYLFHPFLIAVINKLYTIVPIRGEPFEFILFLIIAALVTVFLSLSILTQWYFSFFNGVKKTFKEQWLVKGNQ